VAGAGRPLVRHSAVRRGRPRLPARQRPGRGVNPRQRSGRPRWPGARAVRVGLRRHTWAVLRAGPCPRPGRCRGARRRRAPPSLVHGESSPRRSRRRHRRTLGPRRPAAAATRPRDRSRDHLGRLGSSPRSTRRTSPRRSPRSMSVLDVPPAHQQTTPTLSRTAGDSFHGPRSIITNRVGSPCRPLRADRRW
jgi:hypothetical protein